MKIKVYEDVLVHENGKEVDGDFIAIRREDLEKLISKGSKGTHKEEENEIR